MEFLAQHSLHDRATTRVRDEFSQTIPCGCYYSRIIPTYLVRNAIYREQANYPGLERSIRWSMDPISILSIVGAALSVTKGGSQAIQTLTTLKSRYRNVPLLSTLIGQLYIVQAALDQISAWSASATDVFSSPRYQQLAEQIDTSLHCFCPLVIALQQHLHELTYLRTLP